jgi:hypothetical protein
VQKDLSFVDKMSDPFSVAASAMGVVSLSIQVCNGLFTYYQDFKSQDEEIRAVMRDLGDLAQTLELLHSTISRRDLSRLHTAEVDHLNVLGSHSREGITTLKAVLEKFQKHEAKDWVARLKAASRKAVYPFQKQTIQELQTAVSGLRSNVTIALQVLQLLVVFYAADLADY